MDVKELLTKEIESQLAALKDYPVDSPEYKSAVEGVTKLMDKLNEIDRTEYEYWEKKESREVETDLKLQQLKAEKKDHVVKNCLTATSIIGGFVLTIWGTLKSIEFEKTGTITTIMGRGFIQNLIPKK